jgi:hypothetical protein
MKMKHVILVALLVQSISINAQQDDKWDNWEPFIGNWKGEGIGIPGEGTGSFSFTFDPYFDPKQNVIIRKSIYHYLGEKMYTTLEDTMIIYLDNGTAVFSNTEGFSRTYSISYCGKTITFITEKFPQTPVFKLTYTLIDDFTITLKYEIARDGVNFTTYSEEIGKKEL